MHINLTLFCSEYISRVFHHSSPGLYPSKALVKAYKSPQTADSIPSHCLWSLSLYELLLRHNMHTSTWNNETGMLNYKSRRSGFTCILVRAIISRSNTFLDII